MGLMIRCPLTDLSCDMPVKTERKSFFLAEAEKPEEDKKRRCEAISTVLEREYRYKIRSALDESATNAFTCKICKLIQTCAYGVADITGENPNVLLELGMMMALGKPVIILRRKTQKQKLRLPSNIVDKEVIPFEDYVEIMPKLRKMVENLPQPISPPSPIKDLDKLQPQFANELRKMEANIVREFKESIEEAKLDTILPSEEKREIAPELNERLRSLEEKLEDLRGLGFVTDYETAFLRGNYFYEQGKYKEALTSYNWVLELRPDDPNTLHNRELTYEKLERYNDALADCNRLVELKPSDPDALNQRSLLYMMRGKYDDTFDDLNRALKLKPGYSRTLYNLACLFSLKKKNSDALAYLEKAIDKDKKYREMAKTDKDFDNIRDEHRFKKLTESD